MGSGALLEGSAFTLDGICPSFFSCGRWGIWGSKASCVFGTLPPGERQQWMLHAIIETIRVLQFVFVQGWCGAWGGVMASAPE
jgi:hypothetical protein